MDFNTDSISSSFSSSSPSLYQFSSCSPCNNLSCSLPLESQEQFVAPTKKKKAGRKKFKETRHPVYRGVRRRNGNKWVCEVREPNSKSRIWLGTHPNPEMAARAHDVAALALRGNSAALNFPDSVWLLPRAKSSSARDIQVAALQATKTFMSSSSSSSSYNCSEKICREKHVESSLIDMQRVKSSEKKVLEAFSLDDLVKGSTDQMVPNDQPTTLFLDEEALFNMPGLLDSMAEGLILTPFAVKRGINWDDFSCDMDFNLWNA